MSVATVPRSVSISIHAPREGSDQVIQYAIRRQEISIHAPREGSDVRYSTVTVNSPISIHAPREGSDNCVTVSMVITVTFQSTLPVRGATVLVRGLAVITSFQSTLPVRGATSQPNLIY